MTEKKMRILVEPGCYDCLNMGDVAMLQVLVNRLSQLWPKATLQVLTDVPELLLKYCPNVEPVHSLGRRIWFQDGSLFGPFNRLLPEPFASPLLDIERSMRRHRPAQFEKLVRSRKRLLRQDCSTLDLFLKAVEEADLVVVAGQGSINDSFHKHAMNVLDVLGMAIRRGKPTALFGQGLGPLANRRVRSRVKEVLPEVTELALRESRAALPLLDSLEIDRSSVVVTGDDAVELAYNARASELGNGIGINVRVSTYSHVDDEMLEKVGSVVRRVAQNHGAPLVPVPIANNDQVSDDQTIRRLVKEDQQTSDSEAGINTPLQVITKIGRCRLVLAGSYHAAVFAMSQGIPTVCLAKSTYYIDKFMGLANQFGTGCKVVVADQRLSENLETALEDSWRLAESTRAPLLEAAARQIELSRAAYYRFYEHVTSNPPVLQLGAILGAALI